MCLGVTATTAMVCVGAMATGNTLRRRDPAVFSPVLGCFTLMAALQLAGRLTLDRCGSPANETSHSWRSCTSSFSPW